MKNISPIKPYETKDYHSKQNGKDKKELLDKNGQTTTLKGVLYNKSRDFESDYSPTSSLIIMPASKLNSPIPAQKEDSKAFDLKKALTPLLIGTISLFGITAGMSGLLRKSAKTILKTQPFERLPDLALNMNIKQEPEFATYMMIRNPNFKTIMGAIGVFAMSGLTLISKNFVDGVKEVWIKKQESDIQRDLQENLIETETKVFSGKLQIERNVLSETAEYFEKIFNKNKTDNKSVHKISNTFKSISNFCGKNESANPAEEKNKNNILFGSIIGLTALAGVLFGKVTLKNLKKTTEMTGEYTTKFTETIIETINKAVDQKNTKDVDKLSKLFETICATPEYVRESLSKLGASEEEITKVIKNVADAKKTIFADAPTALGGNIEKIQYYCYLDENRGHLYNWITHPENKFMKYVFLSFTGISAMGYVAKQCIDALRAVAVSKENSNTELGLQKKLIDVEIKNFESKKNSAVKPLIEEFNKRLEEGKSEEEMKNLADNILIEIKNGAPFVYS